MNRIVLIFITFFCLHHSFGQHYEMKKQMTPEEKKELLDISKELFQPELTLSYNIGFEDAVKKENKNSSLEELKNALAKDSLNPVFLYFIANYYQEAGSELLAYSYFQKAFDCLTFKYFHKDSAGYYSFRGMLKSNLQDNTASKDFERSLSINPNDSMALIFYPSILLENGRFSDLKNLSVHILEQTGTFPDYFYIYLVIAVIMERMVIIQNDIRQDENKKAEYRGQDYTQLFDFSLIDRYEIGLKEVPGIKKLRIHADIFALFMKGGLAESNSKEIFFENTVRDQEKLYEIEELLHDSSIINLFNEYELNESLGYLEVMQNKRDKAAGYFFKGLDLLLTSSEPDSEKIDEFFNALLALYYWGNDTANYRRLIDRKISSQPQAKMSAGDYRNLAMIYFLNGQPGKAEEWCKKASKMDPEDFDAMRLLAHMYFLKDMKNMTGFYLEETYKHVSDPNQAYKISLQQAIYLLLEGNAGAASGAIEMARTSYSEMNSINSTCEICDRLEANYIKKAD